MKTLLLLALTLAPLPAAEIKIIANASVKVSEITADELKRVFLLKTSSLRDGGHVVPVIGIGSPAYQAFLAQYMGKSDVALNTYYRSLVFTGKAFMPKLLASDTEVVAYVAQTKGAVGYVSASTNTGGLKSVHVR